MHARIRAAILAAGALALAVGAGPLPAVASARTGAATWTVTPGGSYRAQVRSDNIYECWISAPASTCRARSTRQPGACGCASGRAAG